MFFLFLFVIRYSYSKEELGRLIERASACEPPLPSLEKKKAKEDKQNAKKVVMGRPAARIPARSRYTTKMVGPQIAKYL